MQVRSINRALINLLNNAIKYAGKAKISTRLFDDHCEVVIDDNMGQEYLVIKEKKHYYLLID